MAQPSSAYEPRDPTSTILHGVVRDHFETFRAHAASLRDGEGLPRFVEQEFRDFLRCGCLADPVRTRCTENGQSRPKIRPGTHPNSMRRGEDVASREERCRRGASLLSPHGHFALVFVPIRRQSAADRGPYPRCREGEGVTRG